MLAAFERMRRNLLASKIDWSTIFSNLQRWQIPFSFTSTESEILYESKVLWCKRLDFTALNAGRVWGWFIQLPVIRMHWYCRISFWNVKPVKRFLFWKNVPRVMSQPMLIMKAESSYKMRQRLYQIAKAINKDNYMKASWYMETS